MDKLHYLHAMGIQPWKLRLPQPTVEEAVAVVTNNQHCTPEHSVARKVRHAAANNNEALATLCSTVASCVACSLHQSRTQTVFGVGNTQAELMIIGEAPGFHEDQQGQPFVGRAGQLLNAMLQAIEQDRNTVYIANILKCRPPSNRDPSPEEVQSCTPFLLQQIALIKPKVLLAVGRIAAHYLLNSQSSLGQLRGKIHRYQNIPLIVTYHPAYLLRNPQDKGKAFQDLQLTYRTLLA
jgi:uracil-DNA glycosylase family 4